MIKSIRAEKIYDLVQTIPAITNLVTVFSMKPDDNATPIGNYLFITIVSDNTMTSSNNGYIMKKARVSFHIVTKKTMANTDTPERILGSIIDALNNALVNQGCTKISNFGGYLIQSILEDTVSPIFLEDNRYYQIKDYIFNYLCI